MKKFTVCICSMVLALTALAQPPASTAPVSSPSATASASAPVAASPGSLADKIHQKIDKKMKGHHGITIDGDDADLANLKSDDIPEFVIPIVAITMLTIFGAPVLIVAFIMYFGFSKSRMQHRTVRMLAEKGQPIPPELLAPPTPAVKQRSDMRRGIVLVMVGVGMMLTFGAVEWMGWWRVGDGSHSVRNWTRLPVGLETRRRQEERGSAAAANPVIFECGADRCRSHLSSSSRRRPARLWRTGSSASVERSRFVAPAHPR